ncbi:DUF536 domain-containing protein [Lactobacillus sp. ESL0679]|uniref:DUF536 domain-containing protein n=1 Tax=Lactobacillus sp. ESL0679 TaxID=2983209 RepID=UPI0023F95661|nr:DUF536 domain-containing protein [Lactobacillus sp. ESL0679]MDF7683830.1 DUF536 domain-containing protein [Lactobacillus sp. ESL0679]
MDTMTAKQVFESMNISRSRLYQIIGQLDNAHKPSKDNKGKYIFDKQAVDNIKQYYAQTRQDKDAKETVYSDVDSMHRLVNSLNKQLEIKDQQIAELHKLLDQQQQLNLATSEQNKKLLEQPVAKKHWWQ